MVEFCSDPDLLSHYPDELAACLTGLFGSVWLGIPVAGLEQQRRVLLPDPLRAGEVALRALILRGLDLLADQSLRFPR
jgi:hypothetical protein